MDNLTEQMISTIEILDFILMVCFLHQIVE